MKLGISTACFYPTPIEDSIENIARLGFKNIEIFVNTESEFSKEYIDFLKERTEFYGIEVISIHPFTSAVEGLLLFSDYARRTEDGLDQYERYFERTAELGAKYLVLHGERDVSLSVQSSDITTRRIEVYNRLCERAKKYHIQVAQENVFWCKSNNIEFLKNLSENVPDLRFNLDIKQANRAGKDWGQYLDVMAEKIVNVHINDFDKDNSCLLPGKGCVNYTHFFDALKSYNYDNSILIEVYASNFKNDIELKDSADFLSKFII